MKLYAAYPMASVVPVRFAKGVKPQVRTFDSLD
jgi:hypothetical protein